MKISSNVLAKDKNTLDNDDTTEKLHGNRLAQSNHINVKKNQDERNMGLPDKEKVMQTDENEVESVPNIYPIKLNVLEVMELKSDKVPEKMVQDNSNVEANQTGKLPTVSLKVKEKGKATEVQVEAHN